MTPDEYNEREEDAGRLRWDHVTALTRIAQRELGLLVDGKCGPRTRAALEAQATPARTGSRTPDLTTAAGLMVAYPQIPPLAAAAVEVALSLRGRGEEGANNHGPFIDEIGGRQGYLWCALFVGHCWREAARRAGVEPPAWTFRRPGVAEPGARALALAAAAHGSQSFRAEEALPGDLVLWERSGGHHVGIVWHPAEGALVTVEGNVGRYPARVRDLTHDVHHEPHFRGISRPYCL